MHHIDKEEFKQAVYEIVRIIPYGRATSYGAIAKAISYPNMSRMVGRIMGECDSSKNNIPAHRVVNSEGRLSGKAAFGNNGEMQKQLEAEGIIIVNDKIKHWKHIFWDPIEEIQL
ncbi:MGMT family protein [Dysgonomonas sp. Marseille-P4677]|uniref:MGMT family protein n=1 Tax=Dysgonomonas sp. Marseille-P4677 TaxID=2364790 RepID=UPI001912C1FB|nr:MGMT family protein [Dysgonomonas sp. Marseille-P4677]MBK5721054.1 MGMT family protein [Dysgonomonas sp. Marseille-P4677]